MMERGNEIGVHVIRGGDIVGDHTVMFSKTSRRLRSPTGRTTGGFASGALRAARWVADKKPGIYSMNDVLGLHKK